MSIWLPETPRLGADLWDFSIGLEYLHHKDERHSTDRSAEAASRARSAAERRREQGELYRRRSEEGREIAETIRGRQEDFREHQEEVRSDADTCGTPNKAVAS